MDIKQIAAGAFGWLMTFAFIYGFLYLAAGQKGLN